jgi:hypothetical protein
VKNGAEHEALQSPEKAGVQQGEGLLSLDMDRVFA